MRRWKMILPALLLAFAGCRPPADPAAPLAGTPRTDPAAPAAVGATPAAELAVMSFNIRYGTADDGENAWPLRRDLVVEVIREADPDLLGLQEALRFQLDELAAALPQYAELGEGRDGGTEGEYSAILYRAERFDPHEAGTFWLSDTPDVPSITWGNACVRICSWARLRDRRDGSVLRFYNTHLDHVSQESRVRGTRLIESRMTDPRAGGGPCLLTGDFNAGEDNPLYLHLTGRDVASSLVSPLLIDPFRVLHPDAAPVGTFNGFRGELDGAKIDHILVSRDFEPLAAEIVRTARDGRTPSDHFPVTARLRARAPEARR